ncbi:MAG: hypothetical protein JKY91_00070 [Emcibacter sp.]|nr:hypothetical protein [Emcibacter sp.]
MQYQRKKSEEQMSLPLKVSGKKILMITGLIASINLPLLAMAETLNVANGSTKTISSPLTVDEAKANINGDLINNSHLSLELGAWLRGSIDNNGTINNNHVGVSQSIAIYGILNNNSSGILNNKNTITTLGTMTNRGTINNDKYFKVDAHFLSGGSDGIFNNYGTLNNNYGVENNGYFTNKSTGVINNGGTIYNYEELNNEGLLVNNQSVYNYNGSTIKNTGTLNNNNLVRNYDGGIIENTGIFNNFENTASFINEGRFVNSGVFNNFSPDSANAGTFKNSGSIINTGEMNIEYEGGENSEVETSYGAITRVRSTGTAKYEGDFKGKGRLEFERLISEGNSSEPLPAVEYTGKMTVDGTLKATKLTKSSTTGEIIRSELDNIAFSGVIMGNGEILAEKMSLRPNSRLNAGHSPGLLTITADLILDAGSTVVMELAGYDLGVTYDSYEIFGDLTIESGAILDIDILDVFMPTNGDIFDLAYITGDVFGVFSIVPDDWLVSYVDLQNDLRGFSHAIQVTYNRAIGTSVSEPGVILFLGFGIFTMALMRRSKKVVH